jgi:hypothetical protein
VDVLSGRILLWQATWTAAAALYRDTLGLAITPADAQDSARPQARAAVSGRDSQGFCGPDRKATSKSVTAKWLHAS